MNARNSPLFANPRLEQVMIVLALLEVITVYGSSWLAFVYRHHMLDFPLAYNILSVLVATFYLLYASAGRLYDSRTLLKPVFEFPKIITTLLAPMCMLVAFLFFNKVSNDYSRTWIFIWFLFACLNLLLVRTVFSWWVRHHLLQGRWINKMAMLGTDEQALRTIQHIHALAHPELKLAGVYDVEGENIPTDLKKSRLYHGDLNKLMADGKAGMFDALIISHDILTGPDSDRILQRVSALAMNTYYCLPAQLAGRGIAVQSILPEVPLVLLFRCPMEGANVLAKRLMDIIISGIALFFLAIPFLIIAMLIKAAGPGPVFFRQKRNGFRGEDFEMLKFRSMVQDADKATDETGKELQAQKNDSRITWIGKILRRTSIDELPQLINVLKGDMSLVGPRPHVPSHNSYYENLIDRYASRHNIKPGITGWAQLNGLRGETDTVEKMAKRVEFDIWYVENWRLMLDFKILFLTPFVVLFQRKAF